VFYCFTVLLFFVSFQSLLVNLYSLYLLHAMVRHDIPVSNTHTQLLCCMYWTSQFFAPSCLSCSILLGSCKENR